MSPDTFERQIEVARQRLEELEERAKGPADLRALMVETLADLSATLEELHVAGEELRQQNEELAAAHQIIETERQRYQDLFDFAPDGYLVTDPDGVIYEANRAAATLLGVLPDFLVGKPLSVFVAEENHATLYKRLTGLQAAAETLEDWQISLHPRERPPFPASVTVSGVRGTTGRLTGLRWLIRDITERKGAEEELRSARDQLRGLAAHRETVREEERSSIAQESREELAQVLAIIKMDLARVADTLREDQPALRERTKEMLVLLDTAMRSALQIASDSRPSLLDDLGLVPAIAWQAQAFQGRSGIRCEFTSSVTDLVLDSEQRTAVFRIFQEALTNVARQTKASRVSIALQAEADCFVLTIEGNGKVIPEREIAKSKTLGLLSMRERATVLGGNVAITGLPGGGAVVTVRIPLKRETGTPSPGRSQEVSPEPQSSDRA
jgi:PAS domain S-box-containing protein